MTLKAQVTLILVFAATISGGPRATAQSSPVGSLTERAIALDSQGRHDLAAETWHQVLSINPNDAQALAALAAYYRSVGDNTTAKRYMTQLREANPSDPHLTQLQMPDTNNDNDAMLKEAGRLAAQHHYAEALALYRQAFHGTTPSGAWAVAYYETEAAIPSEIPQAITGLRALVKEFPANISYELSLGRVLTYSPETRLEGVRILENLKGTAAQMNAARDAWRQAILWDPSGPAATETGEQFVARFNDVAVADALHSAPARQPKRIPIEGEMEQGEAYAALAKGDLADAEKQFTELTKIQSQRAKAYMGLGYVAMQRQQFDVAVQNYEMARQAGLHSGELTDALNEAHFWGAMKKGETALQAEHSSDAMNAFEIARQLRPKDPEVLDALGRTWIQMNQPERAAPLFEQSVKLNESRPEAWTNWFGALVQTGHSREVIADQPYIPSTLTAQLAADPEYISILAIAELQTGNEDNFHRLLAQLHNAPDSPRRIGGQMRLASLMLSTNPRDAAREALEVIRVSPDDVDAWKLVVIAEHLANRDTMAQTAIDRMPPQVYAAAQKDISFATTLAAIQQALHHYGAAADLLESARARADDDPAALRTIDNQIAAVSLQQGRPDKAIQGYSSLLQEQPDNSDAWAGLISALHQAGQDRLARAQMDLMPASVRDHLQLDPGYLQVAASVYTEVHETQKALQTISVVRNYYRDRQLTVPYSVEAQRAWALVALGDDNEIANTLVQLGHRSDLTPADQMQNHALWAAWSIRKALRTEKQGDPHRAVAILEMASQAYPENVDIRRALAGTYVRTGNAKSALALYEEVDWYSAKKEDFLGAISAASAARQISMGRQWISTALERYPQDPQILTAAAEFENSAGDMRKAKEYWHEVLNVPEQKLEQQLSQHPDGNIAMPASEALARMLAPHSRLEDEAAISDAKTSSDPTLTSASDPHETDDLALMLPKDSAASSRGAVSNMPQSQDPQPRDASSWLLEKAQSGQTDYHPMSYAVPYGTENVLTPASSSPNTTTDSYDPRGTVGQYSTPSSRKTPWRLQTAPGSVSSQKLSANDPTDVNDLPTAGKVVATSQSSDPGSLLRLGGVENDGPSSAENRISSLPDSSNDAAAGFSLPHLTAAAWRPDGPVLTAEPTASSSSAIEQGPTDGDPAETAARNAFVMRSNPDARRAADELQDLNSRYSPWAGGTVQIIGRSGTPGFDRLTRSELGLEASSVLGDSARLTVITKPMFLTSGTPLANSNGTLDTPYNFGQSGAPLLNQPHFQSGVGGELQVTSHFLTGDLGFTPKSFYVSNVTGSVDLHPERLPFSFGVFRESIAETMLSFAGERDPITGAIWGGVVATGVRGGVSKGTAQSGFYTNVSDAKITGVNVNENSRIEGSAGAYWTFYANALGSLKIGANVTGLHFDQNQRYFTYGQGGYFSPDAYLLVNAPFTWEGRSNRLAYTISGSLGMQSFNEDPALPGSISTNVPTAQTVIGANYSLTGNFAYKLDEHWYLGTFFNVNNASNYQQRTAGFSVRYMKMPQVQSLIGPTGLFDPEAPRPLIIP